MTDLSRRRALKLLSANIALIAAGCGKPPQKVLPYVHMPERTVAGVPLQFASTLPLGGYGRGVLCSSYDGRPIKVSGNPLHPASLGSTDLFAEAHVLSLYDPDRSQASRRDGEITAWESVEGALADRLEVLRRNDGEGLRLLTGPLTSPTNLRQITELRGRYPKMKWFVHDPLADVSALSGAMLAFGVPVEAFPLVAEADILVTLGADPLGPGPAQVLNSRGFAERRRVRRGAAAAGRLYALEATPSQTGAKADHRLTLTPNEIVAVAIAMATALAAPRLPDANLSAALADVVAAIVGDMKAHPGRAIVLACPSLPAEIHALTHWINHALDAPIALRSPLSGTGDGELLDLVAELRENRVDTLLISGCNPTYTAPGDISFDRALLGRARLTVHHDQYVTETGALCQWHVPDSHPLESWGDLRGVEGTASISQPLIDRLYGTRTLTSLLSGLLGQFDAEDYDIVRATWQERGNNLSDADWRRALHDGVVPNSAPETLLLGPPKLPTIAPLKPPQASTLLLRTDPTLYDGSFANNAWLQECPKPLTKEVWGNSLGMNVVDAQRSGLVSGDTVHLTASGRGILVPVRVQPGHAPGVMSLTLGNGRQRGGEICVGVGVDAYGLRTVASPWAVEGASIARSTKGLSSYATQEQFVIDGDRDDIFPTLVLDRLPSEPPDAKTSSVATLLPPHDYASADARWAMTIDAGTCTGCNACVLACQVENNVPVVGPAEIARNRDMHWLRIDTYQLGDDDGRVGFQPVPCMHCETAPCEPVCPVGASIHDSEGLNVQVYNRCVGTRFCEANCPYKVRRFNFFGYADGQEYKNLGAEIMHAHNNPDVTVRARGVMEKCTYCVQRISEARRQAEKESRPLRDGDVTTACQNACPTQAIAFGNLQDKDAQVSRWRDQPQHFVLLSKLNTKPRTTYLADVRNPNPQLAEAKGP